MFDSERPAEETQKQENQTNLSRDGNTLVFRVLIRGFGDSSPSPADTHPSPMDNRHLNICMLSHCTSSVQTLVQNRMEREVNPDPTPPKNVRLGMQWYDGVYVYYITKNGFIIINKVFVVSNITNFEHLWQISDPGLRLRFHRGNADRLPAHT